MSRWRKALIAASVGVAASAAFVMTPADAQSFNLVVGYRCTGGIAGNGPVTLEARVNIPTAVQVGGSMNLAWTLRYTGNRRFMSPDYYEAGALTSVRANMELNGAWNGILTADGTRAQAALQPNVRVETPEGLSSSAHLTEEGVIQLRPRGMTVDFLPPEGVTVVNNDKLDRVSYSGSWAHDSSTREEYHDYLRDVHTLTNPGVGDSASITFRGTGFEYIGRRMPDVSRVRVTVDDDTSGEVDPTKTTSGQPTNAIEGNQSLWKRTDLDYGEHTVTIEALDNAPIHLDAFKLHTRSMIEPPTLHRSTCVVTSAPDVVEIVVGGTSTPTSSPTWTPTTDPTSTGTPTNGTSPSNTPTTGTPNPTSQYTHPGVVVVVPGVVSTATPTTSTTTSVKPTATKYVRPQVAKTPKGGVETGEAPDPPMDTGAYGLIASGSVMIMGSAAGGLLFWRRRAAHAGGVK
ncbi:hypothetical protein ETD86_08850 [Nonomuraea turkmeniaca]|uniref:LPXTG cell wall anchor domain-containing protein n=1 Tax=Nonomuraea turkmeniaca TaxID=103838 RepID=A0A5S4FS61_9ACTN|nr:hypothetical protein [Nonomuraea turkmeniaca]TMR23204.1 hypothetical protein ETD86_08850 [Nonomuraea turkmeniaca]